MSERFGRYSPGNPKEEKGFPGINITFLWETEPFEWGGFSQQQLLDLTQEIMNFFKIPPETRSSIYIHFADHAIFRYSDGQLQTDIALCTIRYDEQTDNFDQAVIIINRSLELFFYNQNIDNNIFPDSYDGVAQTSQFEDGFMIKNNVIEIELIEPWEEVVWNLAEEINHAAVTAKINNSQLRQKAAEKFSQGVLNFLLTGQDEVETIDEYTLDLQEVTAARQVLLFLVKVAKRLGKMERAEYFKKIYRLSLEKRLGVITNVDKIIDDLYIQTGFDPDKIDQY